MNTEQNRQELLQKLSNNDLRILGRNAEKKSLKITQFFINKQGVDVMLGEHRLEVGNGIIKEVFTPTKDFIELYRKIVSDDIPYEWIHEQPDYWGCNVRSRRRGVKTLFHIRKFKRTVRHSRFILQSFGIFGVIHSTLLPQITKKVTQNDIFLH